MDSASEHERFLDPEEETSPISPFVNQSPNNKPRPDIRLVFASIFVLKFGIQFSSALIELPLVRLIERAVCAELLDALGGSGHEAACKVPSVQDKVAHIVGYKSAFDALACILTALLYGSLSNTAGRRFVILLSVTGQLLAFLWIVSLGFFKHGLAAEYFWFSSLFLLLGGGLRVELSMHYTSFCDIIPRQKRLQLLSFLHASDGIAGILGFPASSLLMQYRLWAPFSLIGMIFLLRYAALWYLPETSPFITGHFAEDVLALEPRSPSHNEFNRNSPNMAFAASLCRPLKRIVGSTELSTISSFFEHSVLKMLFAFFLIKRIAFASEAFLSQYASEILHKKLFEVFWLRGINNLTILFTFVIVLPILTRSISSPSKEIWVIRCSLIVLVTGFSILWQGRTLNVLFLGQMICGLGEGLEAGLQSLGTYIVGESKHALFFPFVSILGVAGELIGGPVMARVYALRDHDAQPLGYCFLLTASLFGSMFLGSFFGKLDRLLS